MLLEDLKNSTHFDITTTGMPTPDEIMFTSKDYWRDRKKKEGVLQWMSPDAYIDACREGFRSVGEKGNIESGRDPELVDKYAKMMEDGVKFHLPTLDYRSYAGEMEFSQEGIHRAMAARQLGDERIPVAILKDVGQ